MPMNEKGEWRNPEDSYSERDEYVGYTVCSCGGIKLLQAGYDVPLNYCNQCHEMAASKEDFFTNVASEVLSK